MPGPTERVTGQGGAANPGWEGGLKRPDHSAGGRKTLLPRLSRKPGLAAGAGGGGHEQLGTGERGAAPAPPQGALNKAR